MLDLSSARFFLLFSFSPTIRLKAEIIWRNKTLRANRTVSSFYASDYFARREISRKMRQ